MFCRKCLYDLRGLDGQCPECGRAFSKQDDASFYAKRPLPDWVHAAGCLLLIVAVAFLAGLIVTIMTIKPFR